MAVHLGQPVVNEFFVCRHFVHKVQWIVFYLLEQLLTIHLQLFEMLVLEGRS
jgi:hypothetical protein